MMRLELRKPCRVQQRAGSQMKEIEEVLKHLSM
jgi:hypothetical protein